GFPHRVLLHEVRALLPRRVREHDGRLGNRDLGLVRRLARAVPPAGRVVPDQALALPLLHRLAAGHVSTSSLRPADVVRVEGAPSGVAPEPRRHGGRPDLGGLAMTEAILFSLFSLAAI